MKKLSVVLSVLVFCVTTAVLATDYAELDVSRLKVSTLVGYGTGTSTLAGNLTIASGKTLTLTGVTVTGGTIGSGAYNGTVGATTPSTGAFTTISATGTTTVTNVTVQPSAILAFGASASITNATLNRCKESIGSKYLMAGPSATYSWGMEGGTVTLADNGAGLFTNTYTYVRTYAAAPFPVASYAAAVGNVTNVFTTGQTTNVLISGGAAVAVNVIVTGRIE